MAISKKNNTLKFPISSEIFQHRKRTTEKRFSALWKKRYRKLDSILHLNFLS